MSETNELEKEVPLANNDIENPEQERKKQLFYLLSIWISIILVFTIIIVVIYIILNSETTESNPDQEPKNDTKPEPDIGPFTNSSLKALYDISVIEKETLLFNDDLLDKIYSMSIDDKKVNKTNKYIFNDKGEHKLYIKFNISLESAEYMFKNCTTLKEIELSEFSTENITTLVGMFYGCINLISLNLTSFDTKNVINMSYLFYNCYSLKNILLKEFDTSNVIDMKYMFSGCKSITSLNLKSFNTKK